MLAGSSGRLHPPFRSSCIQDCCNALQRLFWVASVKRQNQFHVQNCSIWDKVLYVQNIIDKALDSYKLTHQLSHKRQLLWWSLVQWKQLEVQESGHSMKQNDFQKSLIAFWLFIHLKKKIGRPKYFISIITSTTWKCLMFDYISIISDGKVCGCFMNHG